MNKEMVVKLYYGSIIKKLDRGPDIMDITNDLSFINGLKPLPMVVVP